MPSLIGNKPNQVPTNGDLGTLAFEDADNVIVGNLNATGVTTVQAGTAAAPAITTTGDTNTGIFFPAVDTAAVSTGGTERMRIDSSGNLLVGITSARANAGDVQVSKGISFPATQSAQSDSNTLDDYEEGTFTPTAVGTTTGGTGTYSLQAGTYTKIGNQLTFDIVLAWSAHTGTGNLQISGLPFTQRTTNGERYSYSIVAELLTYTGTLTTLNAGGNTTISLFSQNSASGLASVAMDTSVSYMVITGTYFV